jgi:hypothetical protein
MLLAIALHNLTYRFSLAEPPLGGIDPATVLSSHLPPH